MGLRNSVLPFFKCIIDLISPFLLKSICSKSVYQGTIYLNGFSVWKCWVFLDMTDDRIQQLLRNLHWFRTKK